MHARVTNYHLRTTFHTVSEGEFSEVGRLSRSSGGWPTSLARRRLLAWWFVFVRCLEDGDHVVGSHGPIGLLQLQPVFLGDLAAVVGPLGGLLDVSYSLVRKVDQDHVGGHTIPSSSFFRPWPTGPKPFRLPPCSRHDAILRVPEH